ncbi:MAG TPA: TonB C-terminal domain-containing protein [Acidobacteriaceae bacterium]|nr:TonB C-terminal domain-containing protein [Acidobacteriaceae bacterium]
MDMPSPELKQLWVRVLKRVHPDLAIDEQDRIRCEWLTKLANEAYQAGDLDALRAVLAPPQTSVSFLSGAAFSPTRLLYATMAGAILICGGLSLYSITTNQHAVANSLTAQADAAEATRKVQADVNQPTPSKWYGDVIHEKISRNLNPSTVLHTPAGATAVLAFTISREGFPQNVSLVASSWHPSLDFSCVNAVRQVRTFGPPEGGAKDSLNVIYDCTYHPPDVPPAPQQDVPPASEQIPAPVTYSVKPSDLYMKQMAERLQQNFRSYELVDASIPAGNSAEMWFDVNRDGSLSNVRIGKPSGFSSLDYACTRAVLRTTTVGSLPESYKPRTLPATFACTYSGSNASHASASPDSAAERSGQFVASVRNASRQ